MGGFFLGRVERFFGKWVLILFDFGPLGEVRLGTFLLGDRGES